jgi:hypothetical protein
MQFVRAFFEFFAVESAIRIVYSFLNLPFHWAEDLKARLSVVPLIRRP